MKYYYVTAIVNNLIAKILFTHWKTIDMSNQILTFCSVVTALTTFSLLNISSADALPANQVSGQGSASVGSDPRGVNRTFSAQSSSEASSPKSVKVKNDSSVSSQPTTVGAEASSSSQAGKVKGSGSAKSDLTATGTGPTDLKVKASSESKAELTGAKTGVVNAGSSSSLNSGGGNATSFYNFSGGK
jgi:hypothetical protein